MNMSAPPRSGASRAGRVEPKMSAFVLSPVSTSSHSVAASSISRRTTLMGASRSRPVLASSSASAFVSANLPYLRRRAPRGRSALSMSLEMQQISAWADELGRLHDSLLVNTVLLADAATDAAQKPGIWNNFVKLIQNSITGIHGAFQSVGIPDSYGLCIIGFTLAVKLVTLPLNITQMESSMKMQALSPKLKSIQTQYRDNPQLQQQMIANLYKTEKVQPLAGCLPLLVQMPIWIGLYRAVLNLAKDNILDEPFLWIPSLQGPVAQGGSIKDWLFPLVNGAPPIGWHDAICYMILPILLVTTQSYSQNLLTPPNQDPQAAQVNNVLKVLPLVLGVSALSFPSGLSLYWVTNTLLSTAQTLVLRKRFMPATATAGGGGGGSGGDGAIDTDSRAVGRSLGEADGFAGGASKGSAKKAGKGGQKRKRK